MKLNIVSILVIFFAVYSTVSLAADRLDLDATEIQGNREQPKVLYVVPWKKSMMDDKPVELSTIADEVMSPVDRDVLRRQIHYYEGTGAIE